MLIDIGANLTNSKFDNILDTVINNAKNKGLHHICITGTSPSKSKLAQDIAHQYKDFLSFSAGIHPHDAKDFNLEQLENLAQLYLDPQCTLIGELGLDTEHQ